MGNVMENMDFEQLQNYIQETLQQPEEEVYWDDMDQKFRRYFGLYQQRLDEHKRLTADIMQLQDKLNQIREEQEQLMAHNRELETLAMYDSLTGLANRGYLNEYLSQKFEEAVEKQKILGVELLDIDHFKAYNDTHGHLAGDVCLASVAKILQAVENNQVFCARYGGDEFMIVYTDMTVQEILAVADTIQNKVRRLKDVNITVTQGIFAQIPQEENREWDFNSMADTVLYDAKREGRNRYRIVTEFDS